MKIVHVALQAPYNEGWGYQENLLTKYQAALGHDVTLIVTNRQNCPDGSMETVEPCDYMSKDGFRVIRLDFVRYRPQKLARAFPHYQLFDLLVQLKPDFIMVHGLTNIVCLQVKKYVKKVSPRCVVIADTHQDHNNSSYFDKHKMLLRFYRIINKIVQKHYTRVYGVTPWRSKYASEELGIAAEKLQLLPAGADDSKIDFENRDCIAEDIRKKHNISPDDFLIVTGGKIEPKKNIHLLMQAVAQLQGKKLSLIVFGTPVEGMKDYFEELSKAENIRSIGWISADETYNYFLSADLVFFPGQHSVMWEQAVACGTPCVFKHYPDMHHCDIGGNCKFLYEDSVEAIKVLIEEILQPEVYGPMLQVACSESSKQFLYSQLARKSLEAADLLCD